MEEFSYTMSLWISRAITLVVAFTAHELAHAYMADYYGDITPRMQGRLTLNPLKHLDPIGTLLLLVAGFGWAKPVQIDPYFLRRRDRYAVLWVSLAGPASNLLLAIIGGLLLRTGLFSTAPTPYLPSLGYVLAIFVFLNLILMLFNLLPLFPLDGEKIVMELFPYRVQEALARIRPYSTFILLAIVFLVPFVLDWLVYEPALALYRLLT